MSDAERIAELERQLETLKANHEADRLQFERDVGDRFSTLDSPVWKRVLFRLDGWGPWYRVRERPRSRPWHRWWVS